MSAENLSDRRKQTRATLVSAGVSVFAVKGIDGASIEEICEAAGFTRGAFYSNFSSRDELVLATIEQRTSDTLDRLDRTIERWAERLPSSGEEIETLLASFIDDTFREKRQTVAETIAEHEIEVYCMRSPGLWARYQELGEDQMTRLHALVQTALDIVGATTTIPLESLLSVLIATFSQSSLRSVAGKALDEPVDFDTTVLVQVLAALLEFPDDPECRAH